MQETRFSQLSKPRKALIRLCQRVNYGSILNVELVDGDFNFDRPAEVVFDLRLEDEVTARKELELDDFSLPGETCRMLAQIDSIAKGLVEKITVHDGIPRRLLLRRFLPPEVLP